MIFATTRCGKKWPWHYTSYFQETKAPYRRADKAHIVRLGRLGIVVGRVTRRIEDPDEALRMALSSREVGNFRPWAWEQQVEDFMDEQQAQTSGAE